jgi:hypothetical protein
MENKPLKLPLEEDDEYFYIPCMCKCHYESYGQMHHMLPCCNDGLIAIKKGSDEHLDWIIKLKKGESGELA